MKTLIIIVRNRGGDGVHSGIAGHPQFEGNDMQVTGMLYGAEMLQFVGFPTSEVVVPGDSDEELKTLIDHVPFDPLTGLKAFVVANSLSALNAPKEIISPLVQQLPKLWELYHDFGMTTLELNPIRMRPDRRGRLTPVACDFKCGFDRDDPRWQRLGLPAHVFAVDYSDFEQEINQLRTYQGQSDVYVINAKGTILAPTFGGGASSLVTEMLGDDAFISS